MYSNYFQNMNSQMKSEEFNDDSMYNGNIDSTITATPSDSNGNLDSTITTTPSRPGGNIDSSITTTPSRPGGNIDSSITTTPSRPGGNIGSSITTTPSRPGGNIGSSITTTPSRPSGNIGSSITTTPSRPGGNIGYNIMNWPLNFQMPTPTFRPISTIPTVFQTCINGLVYVWLKNGENFWMIPTDVYGNAIYGYQWDQASDWYPTGIYLSDIISVTCVS